MDQINFEEASIMAASSLAEQAMQAGRMSLPKDLRSLIHNMTIPVHATIPQQLVDVLWCPDIALRLDPRSFCTILSILLECGSSQSRLLPFHSFVNTIRTYLDNDLATERMTELWEESFKKEDLKKYRQHIFRKAIPLCLRTLITRNCDQGLRNLCATATTLMSQDSDIALEAVRCCGSLSDLGDILTHENDYAFRFLVSDLVRSLILKGVKEDEIWGHRQHGELCSVPIAEIPNSHWCSQMKASLNQHDRDRGCQDQTPHHSIFKLTRLAFDKRAVEDRHGNILAVCMDGNTLKFVVPAVTQKCVTLLELAAVRIDLVQRSNKRLKGPNRLLKLGFPDSNGFVYASGCAAAIQEISIHLHNSTEAASLITKIKSLSRTTEPLAEVYPALPVRKSLINTILRDFSAFNDLAWTYEPRIIFPVDHVAVKDVDADTNLNKLRQMSCSQSKAANEIPQFQETATDKDMSGRAAWPFGGSHTGMGIAVDEGHPTQLSQKLRLSQEHHQLHSHANQTPCVSDDVDMEEFINYEPSSPSIQVMQRALMPQGHTSDKPAIQLSSFTPGMQPKLAMVKAAGYAQVVTGRKGNIEKGDNQGDGSGRRTSRSRDEGYTEQADLSRTNDVYESATDYFNSANTPQCRRDQMSSKADCESHEGSGIVKDSCPLPATESSRVNTFASQLKQMFLTSGEGRGSDITTSIASHGSRRGPNQVTVSASVLSKQLRQIGGEHGDDHTRSNATEDESNKISRSIQKQRRYETPKQTPQAVIHNINPMIPEQPTSWSAGQSGRPPGKLSRSLRGNHGKANEHAMAGTTKEARSRDLKARHSKRVLPLTNSASTKKPAIIHFGSQGALNQGSAPRNLSSGNDLHTRVLPAIPPWTKRLQDEEDCTKLSGRKKIELVRPHAADVTMREENVGHHDGHDNVGDVGEIGDVDTAKVPQSQSVNNLAFGHVNCLPIEIANEEGTDGSRAPTECPIEGQVAPMHFVNHPSPSNPILVSNNQSNLAPTRVRYAVQSELATQVPRQQSSHLIKDISETSPPAVSEEIVVPKAASSTGQTKITSNRLAIPSLTNRAAATQVLLNEALHSKSVGPITAAHPAMSTMYKTKSHKRAVSEEDAPLFTESPPRTTEALPTSSKRTKRSGPAREQKAEESFSKVRSVSTRHAVRVYRAKQRKVQPNDLSSSAQRKSLGRERLKQTPQTYTTLLNQRLVDDDAAITRIARRELFTGPKVGLAACEAIRADQDRTLVNSPKITDRIGVRFHPESRISSDDHSSSEPDFEETPAPVNMRPSHSGQLLIVAQGQMHGFLTKMVDDIETQLTTHKAATDEYVDMLKQGGKTILEEVAATIKPQIEYRRKKLEQQLIGEDRVLTGALNLMLPSQEKRSVTHEEGHPLDGLLRELATQKAHLLSKIDDITI